MRIHCLENVDKSLTFLGEKAVKLENMGAHDIVDGNSRLTLGLIWTIILRFQVKICGPIEVVFQLEETKYCSLVHCCYFQVACM